MVDITGKKDAISKKKEFQDALDYSHKSVKNMVKHLHEMNHKLKEFHANTKKHKKDIVADEEEKLALYSSLNNMLLKETNFEKEMMKTSRKGATKKISIKTKFKDVDDVRFNAMQDYLDKYPEYASKSSFKKILDKIEKVESGIKEAKKKYNRSASDLGKELDYWPKNIMHTKDLINRFKTQKKQFEDKLSKMRFVKSIAFKLSSETEKDKVRIHDLYYRLEESENNVNQLEREYLEVKKEGIHILN
jgi:hypothetical protein